MPKKSGGIEMKCFVEIVTINNNTYRGIESDLTNDEIKQVNKTIKDALHKEKSQIIIERYTNEGRNRETVYFRSESIESIKVVTK